MYLAKTPNVIKNLFPNFIWQMNDCGKQLFLTFDDGPIPEVTPWILSVLKEYQAKATFFCVGDNVERHGDIHQQILDEGHVVGSHTFNHLSGWQTENRSYFRNVLRGAASTDSGLFRPPYGRIKPSQLSYLRKHFRIVMWDVLSGDFDASISDEQCLQNVLQNSTNGSIIVMHDSLKARKKVKYVLPRMLDHFSSAGFSFSALTEDLLQRSEQAA
ncbi:MAG: polysaccharide deacetylase family protein [Saprospiraceae bacterium]|nr:polysaccharide deacetylase family protein [Saprospiraceae bacterium]